LQIKLIKEDMKRITFFAFMAVILVSANALVAQDNMRAKPPAIQEAGISAVTPETFQDYAENNVGKEVEIKGMVIHVCRHGGKKMFIIGENPDMRVKITASDKVGEFKPDLEGSTVAVKGIVEPIEEEVVPDEEKHDQDADHINHYHKPQYAISCMAFRTIDE
jgi:hypothetical protein